MTDPRSFLPLTPLAYQVLLSLADADRHGYGIIREVADRTDGVVRIRTGTLYTMVQRLLDERLLEESDFRPAHDDDERRKYYRLTDLGRDVLAAETRRMEALIGEARRKQVLDRKSGA
ncbi:MAG: PadR family transcriptional regulator [Vicinamibacterales bacterium]